MEKIVKNLMWISICMFIKFKVWQNCLLAEIKHEDFFQHVVL